jgi:hypothetical protein
MVGDAFEADRNPTLASQRRVSRQRFAPGVYRVGTLGREDAALRGPQRPAQRPPTATADLFLLSEVVTRAAPKTRKPRSGAFAESPLPDSNRRPLPYHGSRAHRPDARRSAEVPAQRRFRVLQATAGTCRFRQPLVPRGYLGGGCGGKVDGSCRTPRVGPRIARRRVPSGLRLRRGCDDASGDQHRVLLARLHARHPGKDDRALIEDLARIELGFAALRDAQKRNALDEQTAAELGVRAAHEARRASA